MKVLICSVSYHDDHDVISGRSTWENLAVRYLAAAVSDLPGIEVTVEDNHFEHRGNDAAMRRYVSQPVPDVVGISSLEHNLRLALDLARRIKHATPDVFLVMGGFGPSVWREVILKNEPYVDAIFVGDGETSFRHFVQELQGGGDWRTTPGIMFRNQEQLQENPMPKMIPLDEIKWPVRAEKYPLDECTISTSRGCAYSCSFCSIVPFYQMQPGKAIRYRNPRLIADEMQYLVETRGIKWINFTDDDFLGINRVCKGWSTELANEMIRRNLGLRFFFQTRVDHIQEPVIAILKEAGLRTVAMGVESYAPRMLESLNKKATEEANRQAVEILRRLHVNYEMYSIAVDADSTVPEILLDMNQFVSVGYYDSNDPVPFSMQVNEFLAYPFRNTPLYRRYEKEGILTVENYKIRYDFRDELVRILVPLCGAWNGRWKGLSDIILQYRYVAAIKRGQVREAMHYKRWHNRYFEIDTEWLRAVCDSLVRNSGLNRGELAAISMKSAERLEELWEQIKTYLAEGNEVMQPAFAAYGGFATP